MDWSNKERTRLFDEWAHSHGEADDIITLASLAVELAAVRGGTMTAEELAVALAEIDKLNMPDHWPHDYTAYVAEHIFALGARNAVLEAEVKRLSECASVTETMALRREVAELKSRCATLSAAGQVLSEHVDKAVGHEGCPDNLCPAHSPYCEGVNKDTPQRYPCSATCTHDDAAKPGHHERVKERSEAVIMATELADPCACRKGAPCAAHAAGDDLSGSMHGDYADGYDAGAEAMRAACWEAVQMELRAAGLSDTDPGWARFKSAIEGAAP